MAEEVPSPLSIKIHHFSTPELGTQKAYEILKDEVTPDTLLLLSGGNTPRDLYRKIAREGGVLPKVAALVDERFGPPMHLHSNELTIKRTGLINYFIDNNIETVLMLDEGKDRFENAGKYDEEMKKEFGEAGKIVAVMGIGEDGHTAGILPHRPDFTNPVFLDRDLQRHVLSFGDQRGQFKERITLTPYALSNVDTFVILVFGEDKKEAIRRMLAGNEPREDLPAVMFNNFAKAGKKVILITDQTP